jgi:hypothetical protein
MSIWSKLIGGGVVTAVEGVANVVDRFVETDDEKRAWEQVKAKMAQEPQLAQIELNKVEAGHRTLFVAGARPFILWVCGVGLAFTFLINPLLQWLTGDMGPELPHDIMMELVLGILGLGAFRTVEKLAGKAK